MTCLYVWPPMTNIHGKQPTSKIKSIDSSQDECLSNKVFKVAKHTNIDKHCLKNRVCLSMFLKLFKNIFLLVTSTKCLSNKVFKVAKHTNIDKHCLKNRVCLSMFLKLFKNIFLLVTSKKCLSNTCLHGGQTDKHFA